MILAGCVPEAGPLHFVDEVGVEHWSPDDHGSALALAQGCVLADRHDAAFVATWCRTVSPEPEDLPPDGRPGCRGPEGTVAGDLRCRYDNIIGAVAISGDSATPLVHYCDSDSDGGTRVWSWDRSHDTEVRTLLAPLECRGLPQDGDLGRPDGIAGHLSGHVRFDPDQELRPYLLELAPTGEPMAEPRAIPGTEGTVRVSVSGSGDHAIAVTQAYDGTVLAHRVDGSGSPTDSSVLAYAIRRFAVGQLAGDPVVATCDDDRRLVLRRLSGVSVTRTTTVGSARCDPTSNPGIAGAEGALALTWFDGEEAWLGMFDDTLSPVARVPLGPDARIPEVAAGRERFWTVDATGAVRGFWPDGTESVWGWHPYLPPPDGDLQGLRLRVDDDVLLTAMVVQTTVVAGGHQSLSQALSLSAVTLP